MGLVAGLEPASPRYKLGILPLNYTSVGPAGRIQLPSHPYQG